MIVGVNSFSEKEINICKETWANKKENVFFFSYERGKEWNILLWLYENYPEKSFYYITTSDTYVRYEKLNSWLNNFNRNEKLYIGGDDEEINILGYDFQYHVASPGIILSNKLMKFIYPLIPSWTEYWNTFPHWLRTSFDLSLGVLIEKEKKEDIRSIISPYFFSCNWQGYKNGCICCKEKNLKTLTACSSMTEKDMRELHQIFKIEK